MFLDALPQRPHHRLGGRAAVKSVQIAVFERRARVGAAGSRGPQRTDRALRGALPRSSRAGVFRIFSSVFIRSSPHYHRTSSVFLDSICCNLVTLSLVPVFFPPLILTLETPDRSCRARSRAAYDDDLEVRAVNNCCDRVYQRPDEIRACVAFEPAAAPQMVWQKDGVSVHACAVEHEPVERAVGYRVDTPRGSVVISGDTRKCAALEALAMNAKVLVHEAVLRATQGCFNSTST